MFQPMMLSIPYLRYYILIIIVFLYHFYINNISYSGLKSAIVLTEDIINSTLVVVEDHRCNKWIEHCILFKMKYLAVRTKQEFIDFCILLSRR